MADSDKPGIDHPELGALRFLKELWGKCPKDWLGEFFFIQYRPTLENPSAKRVGCLLNPIESIFDNWESLKVELTRRNRTKVENIHPCVNPRFKRPKKRGRNSDVSHFTALFVDVDFKGARKAIERIFWEAVEEFTKAGLRPSIIINSGHGLHAYWLLEEPVEKKLARACCAGVQDVFKIEDPINDPSRVLRLPGFYNLKDAKDPQLCYIVEASYKRYPISAFEGYAIDPEKSAEDLEDEKSEKIRSKAGRKASNADIERIKKGVGSGERNEATAKYAGHLFGRGLDKSDVLEILKEWNQQNDPPLADDEIIQTVDSIEKLDQENHGPDKRKKRRERAASSDDGPNRFFRGRTFLPTRMTQELFDEEHIISTPIGAQGIGLRLYRYEDGVYQPGAEEYVAGIADEALGERSALRHITEVQNKLHIERRTKTEALNPQASTLINVKNGMLDWKTGELKDHDPSFLSTYQINSEWDAEAKSDVLDKFLQDTLAPDEIPLMEEFLGYLLVPDTSFAKCLVLIGEGGNGKSTFLKLMEHLLGDANVTHYSLHNLTEDKFTCAELFGKLANFYDELESKALENTGTFKLIVSGEKIKGEEKNKKPFHFRPFCRLVFATNQMPRPKDDRSQAYFDRFVFLRFPNRIRGTVKVIRDYDQVLADTTGLLPALLRRAVEGLRRLTSQNKFTSSVSSLAAIEDYRKECSSSYDFVQDSCSFEDPTAWLSRTEIYQKYKVWCDDEGRRPMSSREFNKTLKGLNVREVRHGSGRGWGGIAWKNGTPPESPQSEIDFLKGAEGGGGVDTNF